MTGSYDDSRSGRSCLPSLVTGHSLPPPPSPHGPVTPSGTTSTSRKMDEMVEALATHHLTRHKSPAHFNREMIARIEYLETRQHMVDEIESRDTVRFKIKGKERSGLDYEVHTRGFWENNIQGNVAWLNLPGSIVGLELGMNLAKYQLTLSGLSKMRWGCLCIASLALLTQFWLLRCLWINIPSLKDNEDFCLNDQVGHILQVCSLGVFILSIADSLSNILLELHVVLTSSRLVRPAFDQDVVDVRKATNNEFWQGEYLVRLRYLDQSLGPKVLCLVLVLSELAIWVFTLVCGVVYILSQPTVSDLIQSVVAIVFINDIDSYTFRAFIPLHVTKNIEKIRFEVPLYPGPGEKSMAQNCVYHLKLIGSVPIVCVVSFGIVYGFHARFC